MNDQVKNTSLERHTRHKVIAMFMGAKLSPIDRNAVRNSVHYDEHWYRDFGSIPFDKDWNYLLPVWKKCSEIGLWMSVHKNERYGKLWSEKSEEIDRSIVSEFDIVKTCQLIYNLIDWYVIEKEKK